MTIARSAAGRQPLPADRATRLVRDSPARPSSSSAASPDEFVVSRNRISPAPVPVASSYRGTPDQQRGNAAHNARALGARRTRHPSGADEARPARRVDLGGIGSAVVAVPAGDGAQDADRTTRNQQVARIDYDHEAAPSSNRRWRRRCAHRPACGRIVPDYLWHHHRGGGCARATPAR
jgi:hypothetical protein